MRHFGFLLPIIIVSAVAVGGLLYLYGGSPFNDPKAPGDLGTMPTPTVEASNRVMVLARATEVQGFGTRINYRITEQEQLEDLWVTLRGPDVAAPKVDFDKYEVLAVFDGSHSTGGYDVRVDDVMDEDAVRKVMITRVEPGETCTPPAGPSNPYVLVRVEKTTMPIERVEKVEMTRCP
jgi:hypothetical protein